MHQTFYIDIDEEITSIVDRLRKAKAEEIVIVVPKRALLIQSIVNLKLLKKEAENLKKQIMIVTQDKLGKLLIEKAGILVQQKLDESLEEEMLVFEDEDKEKEKKELESRQRKPVEKKTKEIGTAEYFNEESAPDQTETIAEEKNGKNKEDFEKITNKELIIGISKDIKKSRRLLGKRIKTKKGSLDLVKGDPSSSNDLSEESIEENFDDNIRIRKENPTDKLEKFFTAAPRKEAFSMAPSQEFQETSVSQKMRGIFLSFGVLLALAILLVGIYLFLPKANINISVKTATEAVDGEIKGSAQISQLDTESQMVPIKTIVAEAESSQDFSSTGTSIISNQKAKGKITIYNEYSSSSQPLIATTRFEDDGGKIFRLVEGVTVPGTTKIGNETQPGVIEADVVADESGEDYNIGPSHFSIPGFKGSGVEKYAKFYAKSTNAMVGGGKGNEEMRTISETDINNAKAQLLGTVKTQLKDKLQGSAGDKAIILDEAINYGDAGFTSSGAVGEVSDKFSLTAKIAGTLLFADEEDVEKLIGQKAKNATFQGGQENTSISMEFGKTDVDFNQGTLLMRIHATVSTGPKIDVENLKKGILGKDEDQLKAYLSSYPDVEKVVVEYWPPFISGKIPLYGSRVSVSLDNIQ